MEVIRNKYHFATGALFPAVPPLPDRFLAMRNSAKGMVTTQA